MFSSITRHLARLLRPGRPAAAPDDAKIIFRENRAGARLRQVWARKPIRKWAVPEDDCIAYPTNEFYRGRVVNLSNEGSAFSPRWVALDRYNDLRWGDRRYRREDLSPILEEVLETAAELSYTAGLSELSGPPGGAPERPASGHSASGHLTPDDADIRRTSETSNLPLLGAFVGTWSDGGGYSGSSDSSGPSGGSDSD